MANLIRFLKVDMAIQYLLLFSLLLFAIGYILIGIPLFILGVWQVFSGFVVWFTTKSKTHRNYLIGSISYSAGLYFLFNHAGNIPDNLGIFFVIFLIGVIPIGIAIWYLNLTKKTLKSLTENRVIEYENSTFDDVLDSDEILNNNQNVEVWKS